MCQIKIAGFEKSHLDNKGIVNKSELSKITGVSICTISHMFNKEYCKEHYFKSEGLYKVSSVLGVNPVDILIAKKGSATPSKSYKKTSCEPNIILKQIRESKGIKPKELENLARVRHGLVGDVENGRDTASDSQLAKLARVLETTVDRLKGITPIQTELELVNDVSTEVCTPVSWFDILKEEVMIAHEEYKKATKSEDRERYFYIVRMGIHDLHRMDEEKEENQCYAPTKK